MIVGKNSSIKGFALFFTVLIALVLIVPAIMSKVTLFIVVAILNLVIVASVCILCFKAFSGSHKALNTVRKIFGI